MAATEGLRRSLGGLSETEFRDRFGSEEGCRKALFEMRWREGLTCPNCGHRGFCELKTRKVFQCSRCKKQLSLTAGTVFQDSKLPLTTWFGAIYHLTQSKGGISSIELGRRLGAKQATAWLVKHKLMRTMAEREAKKPKLQGRVEIDDAYLGGERAGGKRGSYPPGGEAEAAAAVVAYDNGRGAWPSFCAWGDKEKDQDMTDVVIVAAARTPIGGFLGGLGGVPADQLGAVAIKAVLERAGIEAAEVSDVILGHVLTAGLGQNPARQAAIKAGVPKETPAITINQVCGSGLRAVAMGFQAIKSGDAAVVVAGGQESMSLATHCAYLRSGQKMGALEFVDTMIRDGLWDAFNGYHMGTTAENVAQKWQITREEQDKFAAESQRKAAEAQQAGRFKDEIVPVTVKTRKGDVVVDTDEHPKPGTTSETLAKLRGAFAKDGTVTAGNASGLNDGASATLLMSAAEAQRRGLAPLARIASWATAGVDPAVMGSGPIPASRKALERAGWQVGDLDLVEANEAFAAQAIAVNKDMGWDLGKVNVNGGAIALGHPIGASGNRVLVTLLYEMGKRDAKKGLATLCIGGGMGIALCVERG